MATSKKYAGLPDLDNAPEIYETPELTDDVSTIQIGTVKTESTTTSENGDERLDRRGIDSTSARRRFETAVVDARDVNFSDTVAAGQRRSYKTRNRRHRRRRHDTYDSDEDSSEEETLSNKIARLKREAEEIRIELANRGEDENDEELKNSLLSQSDTGDRTIQELSKLVDQLSSTSQTTAGQRSRTNLLKRLEAGPQSTDDQPPTLEQETQNSAAMETSQTPLSNVAALSDRLTALETALGLQSVDPVSLDGSILPTIRTLSSRLEILTNTLAPSTGASSTLASSPIANLDALATRIRTLTAESERLTQSRKAALQSMTELHEARLRNASTRHHQNHTSRPGSSHQNAADGPSEEERLNSSLFLDEQASKINALYQVLPTIQNLQPLLPLVLERLKALSAIHVGAAEARTELDEIQKQQDEMAEEIRKWQDAIQGVEERMQEMGGTIKGNVEVMGEMVVSVEERMAKLQKGKR